MTPTKNIVRGKQGLSRVLWKWTPCQQQQRSWHRTGWVKEVWTGDSGGTTVTGEETTWMLTGDETSGGLSGTDRTEMTRSRGRGPGAGNEDERHRWCQRPTGRQRWPFPAIALLWLTAIVKGAWFQTNCRQNNSHKLRLLMKTMWCGHRLWNK